MGGGLSPGHNERWSPSLYRGLGAEPPAGSRAEPPVGSQGGKAPSPEADSSVAFEALAEKPNLTLVTDSFSQFICRETLMFISLKFGGSKSVVFWGGANSPLGA